MYITSLLFENNLLAGVTDLLIKFNKTKHFIRNTNDSGRNSVNGKTTQSHTHIHTHTHTHTHTQNTHIHTRVET